MASSELATAERAPRYAVVGVWRDGDPVEISRYHSYPTARLAYRLIAIGNIPFVGIVDLDDPERGWGPWEDFSNTTGGESR